MEVPVSDSILLKFLNEIIPSSGDCHWLPVTEVERNILSRFGASVYQSLKVTSLSQLLKRSPYSEELSLFPVNSIVCLSLLDQEQKLGREAMRAAFKHTSGKAMLADAFNQRVVGVYPQWKAKFGKATPIELLSDWPFNQEFTCVRYSNGVTFAAMLRAPAPFSTPAANLRPVLLVCSKVCANGAVPMSDIGLALVKAKLDITKICEKKKLSKILEDRPFSEQFEILPKAGKQLKHVMMRLPPLPFPPPVPLSSVSKAPPSVVSSPVPAKSSLPASPSPSLPRPQPEPITISVDTPCVLSTLAECSAAIQHLRESKCLTMDCEGVNLSRDGALTLIQLASPSRVYLFDVLALGAQGTREEFCVLMRTLFDETDRTIILHDCRRDSEALFYQLGLRLNCNVHDTQVMYAMLEGTQQLWKKRMDDPGSSASDRSDTLRRIGLNKLLTTAKLKVNQRKLAVAAQMDANPKYWAQRPLTKEMIEYATADVTQLFALDDWLLTAMNDLLLSSSEHLSALHAGWFISRSEGGKARESLPLDVTLALRIDHANNTPSYTPYEKTSNGHREEKPPSTPAWAEAADAELGTLLSVLPQSVCEKFAALTAEQRRSISEVLLHSYRAPTIRYHTREEDLPYEVTESDMSAAVEKVLQGRKQQIVFSSDKRAGLPGCLHRISAIMDRRGDICGLTYRVGRYIPGCAELIRDLVALAGTKNSLLLLGPPGVGKTTLLRDVTKLLADELSKRVVVVDTSNEIAGDHPKPHSCIGRALRLQVPERLRQHETLVEAVQNQNPEIIVVDEIGTAAEVEAARTIANRGVGMIGTAHGISLRSLMKNPTLKALVGGINTVTLGDAAASKRPGGAHDKNGQKKIQKTQLERAGAPTFGIVVELLEKRRWRVYRNVADTIDELLVGNDPIVEDRWMDDEGKMFAKFQRMRQAERSEESDNTGRPNIEEKNWFEELIQLAD